MSLWAESNGWVPLVCYRAGGKVQSRSEDQPLWVFAVVCRGHEWFFFSREVKCSKISKWFEVIEPCVEAYRLISHWSDMLSFTLKDTSTVLLGKHKILSLNSSLNDSVPCLPQINRSLLSYHRVLWVSLHGDLEKRTRCTTSPIPFSALAVRAA